MRVEKNYIITIVFSHWSIPNLDVCSDYINRVICKSRNNVSLISQLLNINSFMKCAILQVELLHQDGVTVVNGIKPLRERTLTGTVNKFSHGNGMIDDDIYFTLSSCCHGYHPAIGDDVSVVCVECMHQRHNWRAYSVQPTEPDMNKR